MIRRATPEDAPRITDLGAQFHAYSPWRDVPFNAAAFEGFAAGLAETGAVFLTDSGMCGGLISPLYFNPAFKLAVELFWWAPEGGGKALREAFEDWALENGADGFQFSALADDQLPRVTEIYRRAGFRPAETAFVKRV